MPQLLLTYMDYYFYLRLTDVFAYVGGALRTLIKKEKAPKNTRRITLRTLTVRWA
jgi:hypothetical protein